MSKFKKIIADKSFFLIPKWRMAKCYECGIKFIMGDVIQKKITSGKIRWYHLSCWEKKLY